MTAPPWLQKTLDWATLISLQEKFFFLDHLRVMVKAGISIAEALAISAAQTENRKLKIILAEVKSDVEKGQSFADTLHKHPKLFPSVYVSMVRAGEVSGRLEEALLQVATLLKKTAEMRGRVRSAMLYPAVVVLAVVGIGIEMMFFVLPKLLVVFKEFPDAKLPLATRVLIAVTDAVTAHGILVGFAALALIAIFVAARRRRAVRRALHGLLLKTPIFGPISLKVNVARFATTVKGLLQSGVAIIDALTITSEVVPNVRYREALSEAGESLRKGTALSEALRRYHSLFPPLVTEMIAVGERSGTVEDLLGNLAEFYSEETDRTLKNLTTVIEPLIIVVLGVVVGGMAVAVIMPIYDLAEHISA